MTKINSRRKGHDWERLVARECRLEWPEARRGMQGDGARVPDVDGTPFWIECKCGSAAYVRDLGRFARQAAKDALAADDPRPIRIMVKTTPRGGTMVLSVGYLRDGRLSITVLAAHLADWFLRGCP